MTRKDYIQIAKVFSATLPPEGTPARSTWTSLRNAMVLILAGDNPRFSKERFVAACEERE